MPPSKQISNRAPGLKLGDIYYILFRQKRWIIACTAAGLLAAGIVFVVGRPGYQSEAKLLVRYVLESKSPSAAITDSQIRSPDVDGRYIINTEVEILESFDLSKQVVDAVGIEKIIPGLQGPDARDEAATFVNKNLTVQTPSMSSVIRVVFQHPDPEVVQPVLRETIEKYLKKHINIHQGGDDFLTQQVEKLQSQLARTEQELYSEQISKTHREIFDSQSELAERQAALKDMTNAVPDSLKSAQANPAGEYKGLLTRLDQLGKKRQDLLSQFTEESMFVKDVNQQIAEAEAVKKNLEVENPQLANLQSALLTTGGPPSELLVEPSAVSARIVSLESKIQALKSQLVSLRTEAVDAAADKTTVDNSRGGKEPDEASDQHLSASAEEARFDELVRNSKDSDISVIQSPSPPIKATSKIYKMMAGISMGGFGVGLVLAFFLELKLDQSVRRPVDVLTKLRLPLYLCIPRARTNGHNHVGEDAGGMLTTRGNGSSGGRVLDRLPSLQNYYEALRAKLLMDFEIRNLVHKPKLLAVTSCNRGAGVTTVAVGLAACLSQTGDGKVLLVDVTQEKAATHQFLNGKPVEGLEEALPDIDQTERFDGGSQPRNVARQMSHLMPKLKASSYDYIIFDMPPISQTSITLRLAGLVDTVVLVLESEKTNRGLALHATAELAESKAHVCAVLNKTQTHVPRQLHHEFLGDS